MAKSSPLSPPPFPHPAVRAQLELGGGLPTRVGNARCWRGPEFLEKPSAEQSGRELQAMEWRRWITCACWREVVGDYGVGDAFLPFFSLFLLNLCITPNYKRFGSSFLLPGQILGS